MQLQKWQQIAFVTSILAVPAWGWLMGLLDAPAAQWCQAPLWSDVRLVTYHAGKAESDVESVSLCQQQRGLVPSEIADLEIWMRQFAQLESVKWEPRYLNQALPIEIVLIDSINFSKPLWRPNTRQLLWPIRLHLTPQYFRKLLEPLWMSAGKELRMTHFRNT